MTRLFAVALALLVSIAAAPALAQVPQTLESQLRAEDLKQLVSDARDSGDAQRGAMVFYQPHLVCTTCHVEGASGVRLGPDLALAGQEKPVTGEYLIQSLLDPSKEVKQGYETVTVITADGRTLTGLPAEEAKDKLVLRDVAQKGKLITLAKSEIEEQTVKPQSIMPTGLVNQLTSRQQFLDLAKYLIEVADGGPERARQLRPWSALFALPPLPEYEQRVDHAGLIKDLDGKSLRRGEEIYNTRCVNCHGTVEKEGSLPTSLRFAKEKFKQGSDPYSMYRTVTHGFNMMVAQRWMVPRQKYDVIHYIRETYVKPHNASQYTPVTDEYLASLPAGDTRGPEPTNLKPWSAMDYGPNLTATYEIGSNAGNFAYKGIAVRLDHGPGGVAAGRHWMVFDHDTLRMAAAWHGQGFIDWRGINFNGQHNQHPHVAGTIEVANPTAPGWGRPGDGSFEDIRLRGRDNRAYGPLPQDWAHYRGLYHFQDRVILSYTVGQTEVLEMPLLESAGSQPVYARAFNLGPRKTDLVLQVARHPQGKAARLTTRAAQSGTGTVALLATADAARTGARTEPAPEAEPNTGGKVKFDGATYAEVSQADAFKMRGDDFTIFARFKTSRDGSLVAKTKPGSKWVPDGKTLFIRGGRLTFDIGWVGAVRGKQRVTDNQWHDVALCWRASDGRVQMYVDGKLDASGQLQPKQQVRGHVLRIGYTAPNFPEDRYFQGELSEVRFYHRELSADEVAALPKAAGEGIVARWQLENAAGAKVADRGGKHNAAVRRGEPTRRAPQPQTAQVAGGIVLAGLAGELPGAEWIASDTGDLRLKIPAGDQPLRFTLWTAATANRNQIDPLLTALKLGANTPDLSALTQGGPARWPQELHTKPMTGADDGPYAIDVLSHPEQNPWQCQIRTTGLDFLPDDKSLAVCTWDGDVWLVRGIDDLSQGLTWRRIASGLFQPLGLKLVHGKIHVTCRDQLVILHDLNGDLETDFYENFNNDHQVTEHFHEFAMGLQTDDQGNFYYAKSARHALKALVPHHGTLLKISQDGSKTEILANGFRAANGVCLNPDGTFFVTDQEGHWTPKNRINWVQDGGFYGNIYGYTDVTDTADSAMQQPLCWITNAFDRSPAELLWVDSKKWGPLAGSLLNLSYGYGKVFVVPHEKLGQQMQGGMCELPLPPFPTGLIRGRFHPDDGQLYACGMFAWAGSAQQPGGLYRIRYTGKPVWLPVGLSATQGGMRITFSDKLDPQTAADASKYDVKVWSLKRSAGYGSKHLNEHPLKVTAVRVSEDARTVTIELADLAPTMCMEIRYSLRGPNGEPVVGKIHNTVHGLK